MIKSTMIKILAGLAASIGLSLSAMAAPIVVTPGSSAGYLYLPATSAVATSTNCDAINTFTNQQLFTTPGKFSFTVPAGVSCLKFDISGGGGGGAGGSTGTKGGDGSAKIVYLTVTSGIDLTIYVGGGGGPGGDLTVPAPNAQYGGGGGACYVYSKGCASGSGGSGGSGNNGGVGGSYGGNGNGASSGLGGLNGEDAFYKANGAGGGAGSNGIGGASTYGGGGGGGLQIANPNVLDSPGAVTIVQAGAGGGGGASLVVHGSDLLIIACGGGGGGSGVYQGGPGGSAGGAASPGGTKGASIGTSAGLGSTVCGFLNGASGGIGRKSYFYYTDTGQSLDGSGQPMTMVPLASPGSNGWVKIYW